MLMLLLCSEPGSGVSRAGLNGGHGGYRGNSWCLDHGSGVSCSEESWGGNSLAGDCASGRSFDNGISETGRDR